MRDLKNARWIWAKGWLLLGLSLLAGGMLIARTRDLQDAALLIVCVWAATRWYFFAFYVIEKYVDPTHRFDGLYAFAQYAWRNAKKKKLKTT